MFSRWSYLGLPWALFFWIFPFRAKICSFHPKNAQFERTRSIAKWFWCVSAHFRSFPADFRETTCKSRFPLIYSFSAKNLKRANKCPGAPKSDQMEDPGMRNSGWCRTTALETNITAPLVATPSWSIRKESPGWSPARCPAHRVRSPKGRCRFPPTRRAGHCTSPGA